VEGSLLAMTVFQASCHLCGQQRFASKLAPTKARHLADPGLLDQELAALIEA
jgi:hypothetical protein